MVKAATLWSSLTSEEFVSYGNRATAAVARIFSGNRRTCLDRKAGLLEGFTDLLKNRSRQNRDWSTAQEAGYNECQDIPGIWRFDHAPAGYLLRVQVRGVTHDWKGASMPHTGTILKEEDAIRVAPSLKPITSRVPELDGFRACAVLMVLVHHLFYWWKTPALARLPHLIRIPIEQGWRGVDLFFVLSGFLITGILLDSKDNEHYFRNFYSRRVLRIVPLYLTCIILMYFGYRKSAPYFVLSLLYLANFAYYFRVGVPHGPGVFWSLAVEEHFYLVWPFAVRLFHRFWLLVLILVIVVGSPILRGVCAHAGMDPEQQIYTYSFFRLDALAMGGFLALWARSRYYNRTSAWTIAGVLVGITLLVTLFGRPYGIMNTKSVAATALHYSQVAFIFAMFLVLALANQGSIFTALLRTRAARITADLSYCIYLIHLTIGDFYYRILNALRFNDVSRLGVAGSISLRIAVVGTITFGLAALSKRFLEDPFLRLKQYFWCIPSESPIGNLLPT
jgi:peptidoglycan/LPS O-acetylase OafA/YrhL